MRFFTYSDESTLVRCKLNTFAGYQRHGTTGVTCVTLSVGWNPDNASENLGFLQDSSLHVFDAGIGDRDFFEFDVECRAELADHRVDADNDRQLDHLGR